MASIKLIQRPSDLTVEWLTEVLGGSSISTFEYKRVGTGQMSECYRVKLSYNSDPEGPASVILKVAAQDENSKQTGAKMGLYQREILFYQQIALNLPDAIAHCYHASYDAGTKSFCLLLEDAVHMDSGDDVKGATLEQAKACLAALGQIHGKVLREGVENYPWLKRESPLNQALMQQLYNGFVARYREQLAVDHFNILARFVSCFDNYMEQQSKDRAQGMIHGDFRLDNILFGDKSTELIAVDWQTISWGPILGDVAYFLGCAVPTDLRRAHFEELLETYHSALGTNTMTIETCRENLRKEAFFGVMMGIVSPMLVERTDRGDIMFMTMLTRHCELILDLKSVDTLPETTQLGVMQPLPEDEKLHPSGDEPLYNESYYFDFVDPKQDIAVYVRLGITPNVSTGGWYLAVISRKGKPLITVMDFAAPIPDSSLLVKGVDYEAEHEALDLLKVFNIKLKGKASVYEDESAPLRGEPTQAKTDVSLDLNFHTDGIPYRYRVTTRYEIPCIVDGKVTVDGEQYTINRQAGQRDHSWGVRNWWNMDWIWSALHFEDGTHVHAIDLTVHGQGQLGVGYLQDDNGAFELNSTGSKWDIDSKTNLITSTVLDFTPQGQQPHQAKIESICHGPLRLVSEDGKVALFDRAWCKCSLQDGRKGYGWVEWNRVQ